MTIVRRTSSPEAYEIPSLSKALPFRGLQAKDMDYLRFTFRDPKNYSGTLFEQKYAAAVIGPGGLNLIVFVFMGPGPRVSERNLKGAKTII